MAPPRKRGEKYNKTPPRLSFLIPRITYACPQLTVVASADDGNWGASPQQVASPQLLRAISNNGSEPICPLKDLCVTKCALAGQAIRQSFALNTVS